MKYGMRKPSIKKSVKARTTGKVKRQIKKSVNPLYGKKGMGVVNDPKKAAYNAVYDKTSVGVGDIVDTTPDTQNIPDSPASVVGTIGSFFQLLFALLKLGFYLAIVIGIIALIIWIL